jgi:class 3 adenylate cyclase
MNTASRMESTGQPGKIQISEETAEFLIEAGKESWLTPREERIVAKGKGELQTYCKYNLDDTPAESFTESGGRH